MVTVIEEISEAAREELEREELLDAEDPFRHLRDDDESDIHKLSVATCFIPTQQPSIKDQIIQLSFGKVSVRLAVDAGPGCGGIAWPAGEVCC